jgi:hypothetical protein
MAAYYNDYIYWLSYLPIILDSEGPPYMPIITAREGPT